MSSSGVYGSREHGPFAKSRLIVVSLASAPPDEQTEAQLDQWESDLREQDLRMIHAELGEEEGAAAHLWELIEPHMDEQTQLVVLRAPGDAAAQAIAAVTHVLTHRLRSMHSPLPELIVVDEGTLVDGDLPAALMAALSAHDSDASNGIDERLTAFRELIGLGDPFEPMPVGLLIAKAGPLTDDERCVLEQLQHLTAPAPLLCLTLADPLTDMDRLKTVLSVSLTPLTPTVILANGPDDRSAVLLSHELMMFSQDLHSGDPLATPVIAGLCNPTLKVSNPHLPLDALKAFAETAKKQWSDSVAWQDQQYLKRLQEWVCQPGNCSSRYPYAGATFVRYWARLLSAMQGKPHVGIDALVSLLGLARMPPLPGNRRFETLILTQCAFTDFKQLPAGIKRLHIRDGGLIDIELDPVMLSHCEELHLERNAFTKVPACIWQLPKTVQVYLDGNPLSDNARRTLAATRNVPGYLGPTFVLPNLAPTEETEPDLARALRAVFGSDSISRVPVAWSLAIRRMAKPEFIDWVTRLSELPGGLRERIAPMLGSLMAQCAISKSLRRIVLQTVYEASISCNDRILLSWERVQLARRCHDAIRHKWPPAELISLARQVFRIEEMMKMAQQKIRQLHQAAEERGEDGEDVDDLQAVMAYLSMGHGPLGYDNDTGFGQFINEEISGVSLKDVARAIKQIQRSENAHFLRFLVTWEPWIATIKARKPDQLASLQNDFNNDELRQRITRRVTRRALEAGLTGHELDDAVTKGMAEFFERRRYRRLSRLSTELLQELGAADLLSPPWPAQETANTPKKK